MCEMQAPHSGLAPSWSTWSILSSGLLGQAGFGLMSSARRRHLIHRRSAPACSSWIRLFARILQLSQNHRFLLSTTRLIGRHQLGDDLHGRQTLRADQLLLGTTRDRGHQHARSSAVHPRPLQLLQLLRRLDGKRRLLQWSQLHVVLVPHVALLNGLRPPKVATIAQVGHRRLDHRTSANPQSRLERYHRVPATSAIGSHQVSPAPCNHPPWTCSQAKCIMILVINIHLFLHSFLTLSGSCVAFPPLVMLDSFLAPLTSSRPW